MFTNGDAYTTNTISSQNVFFEYFKKEFGRHYKVLLFTVLRYFWLMGDLFYYF